jgi:methylthioribulose-1-phosphate dehydratase
MASEAESRQQLSHTLAEIHRRGWCDGTGGNFSSVLQRQPLLLLMAPSGVPKGLVQPEQFIVVDEAAGVVGGEGRASAETLLHLAIVETTGAGAVLHTHSQAATLLSQRVGRDGAAELLLEDLEMLKGLSGVDTHATAVAVPVLPNDQNLSRLSESARPLLHEAPHGLLIAGHGLYAWGQDLAEAQRHLEILEFLLEQRWRQLLLEPKQLVPVQRAGISCVLLDIEGTTCPVEFVSSVLFPYAAANVENIWQRPDGKAHDGTEGSAQGRSHDREKLRVIEEALEEEWQSDSEARQAGISFADQPREQALIAYVRWLIQHDRKLTALKDLQGLIWEQGYSSGELTAPLFADVPAALRRWHGQGFKLAVYSSGSVPAQQLLYGHSSAGDLRPLFSGWFDTRIGSKQAAQSYDAIVAALQCLPSEVLFISDAAAELQAAAAAGLQTLFSDRPGNPEQTPAGSAAVKQLSQLQLTGKRSPQNKPWERS